MLRRIVWMAALLATFQASQAHSQAFCRASDCELGHPQYHKEDNFEFITTSYVKKIDGDKGFLFGTCVKNLSPYDLDFNWYIPGPSSWIPPGCALISERERARDERLEPQPSCLRYGSTWKTKRAEFIPHVSDKALLEAESGDDCKSIKSSGLSIEGESDTKDFSYSKDIEVFAPSALSDVETTLSSIRLTSKTDGEYLKYGTEVGISQEVSYSIHPAYQNNTKFLSMGFTLEADESAVALVPPEFRVIQVRDLEGSIQLNYSVPLSSELTSAKYNVISSEGKPVASIFLPWWVESQKQ